MRRRWRKLNGLQRLTTTRLILLLSVAAASSSLFIVIARHVAASGGAQDALNDVRAADEVESLIDAALYTRAEFFGAQARVPYPTAEARNRLAALREQRPDEQRIVHALARLDEKLGRYDLAEAETGEYVVRAGESYDALAELAAFQHRRALSAKEATTLERMLGVAPDAEHERTLERLVRLAESQKFDSYLSPDFFERVIAARPADFRVVSGYINRLAAEKNTAAALEAVRRYRSRFASRRLYFLEKEVSLLDGAGRAREAEAVYRDAFDPFWSREVSERFYDFLREHDRFRAYGDELREACKRNPADFRAAVRLFDFRKHAYEETDGIFARLEEARAKRGTNWETEELTTVARLLIKEGDGDAASRFLYTLIARGQLEKGTPARAKVLYQLFELLCDAGDERLAVTRGDLRFYRDVAASDPQPGMLGGILSLIFSDTNPSQEMNDEDAAAVKFFNRASAYRIFQAYKEEYPTSPELAQMYLDVVRLYTAAHEPRIAADALAEFEQRYCDAPQYPEVALKLADCYVLLGKHEEERALYRRVLDYLGAHRHAGVPLIPAPPQSAAHASSDASASTSLSEPTGTRPSLVEYPPKSNAGIRAVEDAKSNSDDAGSSYRDFMSAPAESLTDGDEANHTDDDETNRTDDATRDDEAVPTVKVVYAGVLARYVASLAKENKTADVLALYAGEIKKYPDEQALYEQMLQWLGQTNLFDEQLRVYKDALARFANETWRDRVARWLLRRERKKEFEDFSRDLVGRLDDREAEQYLEKFVSAQAGAASGGFESNLYLGLYQLAHRRFPQNLRFVQGLLKFYDAHGRIDEYRHLLAEYYFVSPDIREQFLAHLAERGDLRARLDAARDVLKASDASPTTVAALPYKLFRADAAARLSNYEEAVDAYRELNRLYPATPEFAERLIAFTRSLGQHQRKFLEEAADAARALADANPSDARARTRAGEVFAELGDYARARGEWSQLVSLAPGDAEAYLDAATVYWDYFQYGDALATIDALRRANGDRTIYAFEAGAILEAQHHLPQAINEYVKALDENAPRQRNARARLATLLRRTGTPALVAASYSRERAENPQGTGIALGYAGLLKDVGRQTDAARLLAIEVARSRESEFIEAARAQFAEADDARGERACLSRLRDLAVSPRRAISYSLQLAASYAQQGERESSASVLRGLVREFPVNYGVLQEASRFYARLGLTDESLQVLRAGLARSKGQYRRDFARTLAARLLELNRLAEGREVLASLHKEDPLDLGVFRELARVYIRAGDAASLKVAFGKTLDAVRATDAGFKEMREQVNELRRAMIGAFTQLRDYRAAMEQHVEIVNRDPDDEENVEAAISYATRYGGADELLSYYQKTAAQAYKNYRWDVVLARIYEAKGDLDAAARSYKEAIGNQPEMVELHAALAEVYVKANQTNSALQSFDRAAELSNDDPQYVRRIVEVLEKAGRAREAEVVRRKLPVADAPRKESAGELFSAAAQALSNDRAKAVAQYREAFASLSADPYKHDLRASEITGYVQAVRDGEGLDKIFSTLWDFRKKLIADANLKDGANAGKARTLLDTLDGALPDAVGRVAAQRATGNELAPLCQSIREKIDDSLRTPDAYATTGLLLNLSHRAGFSTLEERILAGQMDAARASANAQVFHERLRALVSFYAAGGEYERIVALLEAESLKDGSRQDFEYASLLAEYARLSGDGARELNALRSNYESLRLEPVAQADPLVERYFDVLYNSGEQGMDELRRRAHEPSRYCLQLINYLIAKGERELAHEAVGSAPLPAAWKLARNAQASLALREFDARGEGYFADALQPSSIGELLKAKTATQDDAAGEQKDAATDRLHAEPDRLHADERSRLEMEYGRWLYLSGEQEKRERARAALPSVVESRPRDADAQRELGRWYLAQSDTRAALEHLAIAHEESPDDARTIADLGSAHFLLGELPEAEALWSKLLDGDAPAADSYVLYLNTLAAHGLAREARLKLFPILSERLNQAGYGIEGGRKKFAELKPLLIALSSSFGVAEASDGGQSPPQRSIEDDRAAFLRKLCAAAPKDTDLPQLILEDGLVGRGQLGDFYALLVARSELESYDDDYEFTTFERGTFGVADVEQAFDHAKAFRVTQPNGYRVKWQKKYLDYLLDEGRNAEAAKLAASVEGELARRYARPEWLRLARVRLELRGGKVAQAISDLKRFTGSDVAADLAVVSAPSAERLSEAVALLKAEHAEACMPQLLEATYAQLLALGQYQTSYFVGLARVAFEAGDATRGNHLLRLLVAVADNATKDEAAAEIASLPEVSERFASVARAETPEPLNRIERAEALQLAAQTAATFGQYEEATQLRLTLSGEKPDDYTNRVELARLLATCGRREEAVAQLARIISDHDAPRAVRWQSVWIAPEVTGSSRELWDALVRSLGAGGTNDEEMAVALQARELWSEGRAGEAADLVERVAADDPNPLVQFFRGVLDSESGRDGEAADAYAAVLHSQADEELFIAFGADEQSALEKLIRLRVSAGCPLAALKLAALDPKLDGKTREKVDAQKSDAQKSVDENALALARDGRTHDAAGYRTLRERAETRRDASSSELAGILSAAAEQVKDFDKAIEFEQAHLSRLAGEDERRASAERVKRLDALQKEEANSRRTPLVVDRSLVANLIAP